MANTGNTSSFQTITDWSSTESYVQHDIVKYQNNYYFAMKSSIGVSPVNGLNIYWNDSTTFVWKTSYGSPIGEKVNTQVFTFNQSLGASSIKKTDINNSLLVLDLTFAPKSDKETNAILFFLELNRGSKSFKFYIDEPYSSTIWCACSKWSHSYRFYNNNEIKATFEEVG